MPLSRIYAYLRIFAQPFWSLRFGWLDDSRLSLSYLLAHVVPEKRCQSGHLPSFSNRADMSSRTGLEAEAINRLTDGVEPREIRAILVQCLAGELAPSDAV